MSIAALTGSQPELDDVDLALLSSNRMPDEHQGNVRRPDTTSCGASDK